MSLGALEPQFWKLFCATVGRPDWNTPAYFEPGPHQHDLQQEVAEMFRTLTLAEWTQVFADTDCCCEEVLNLEEVMADEQTRQRQMVVELLHASWGAYRQLGIAPKFSLTPGTLRSHAPELGEHTAEILAKIGVNDNFRGSLRQMG